MSLADRKQQAILAAILQTAVDAIVVIDGMGTVQLINSATEVMFGYSEHELLGQNVNRLMPAPEREMHDEHLRRYQQTGVASIIGIGREVTARRRDGSTFPVHLAVSEIQSEDQVLFAGIIRDISDLKSAQNQLLDLNEQLEQKVKQRTEELRAAQQELIRTEKLALLGQVSGGIAHEIRNPLNAVKTSVYYLQNAKNPTPEKNSEHLDRIDRQVTLINNVITALTDVARMPEPNAGVCNVGEILISAAHSVSIPPGIELSYEIDPLIPEIRVDANQISIVLRNLVRNARDAMPTGGTMRLAATSDHQHVRMSVSDTGGGIDPEHLSKILEPLYTTKARGMGLGLAISKAIVEKNSGKLEFHSTLGQGSTFTVLLPRG